VWYYRAESYAFSTTSDSWVVANDVMQHQRHTSQACSKWLGWSGFLQGLSQALSITAIASRLVYCSHDSHQE